jgi:hypothetical protein
MDQQASRSCGVIYTATGQPYVNEALDAARALRRHWSGPCIIFGDVPPQGVNGSGIEFRKITPSGPPAAIYTYKIGGMLASPFERTLYLDSDTHTLGKIDDIFALFDKFDVAAAHAPFYRGLEDPLVPRSFYELNAGVVGFRRTPAVDAFLADWLETYLSWIETPPFPHADVHDQPAFRHCLWKHGLQLYVLGPEYNYRPWYAGILVDRAVIIHGRFSDVERIGQVLNARSGPRVFEKFSPTFVDRVVRKAKRILARAT